MTRVEDTGTSKYGFTVADPEGDPGVDRNPPFGLHLALRSTDDRLNGTPLSGYKTKKTAAMAHLRML